MVSGDGKAVGVRWAGCCKNVRTPRRPLSEEIARLVRGFDAIAAADRARRDYLAVADRIIEFVFGLGEDASVQRRVKEWLGSRCGLGGKPLAPVPV